jgi:hypothetical protein
LAGYKDPIPDHLENPKAGRKSTSPDRLPWKSLGRHKQEYNLSKELKKIAVFGAGGFGFGSCHVD